MQNRETRVGLIGAGYIAAWHAEAIKATPGARLVAVCDPAPGAAQALGGPLGAQAFASLEAMLAEARLDAVHVLTPPHLHAPQALQSLAAGAHVLVEKPFALDRAEAEAMQGAARAAGRQIAVNHNFLALPAYLRLKQALADGVPGRIDSADIRWRYPLAPLRSGPYGLWMLRAPQNLLFELGPHLFAFATDLFGPMEALDLRLSHPITLPGGVAHHQGWQIRGRAGRVEITLHLALVEGAEDRLVELHGIAGTARLNYGADTLVIARPNAADIVANPLRQELSLARQHLAEGLRNAWRQAASLNRRSPYGLGFQGAIGAFYQAVASGGPMDPRFGAEQAVEVIGAIERAVALLPTPPAPPAPQPKPQAKKAARRMLVIGGTGFIGRALVRALAGAGHAVRVLSRGGASPFSDLGETVEMFPAALHDAADLERAMAGVDTVYHLARAEAASWEGYLRNDVAVSEGIARAALAAGVRRMVYTGTIASYDASRPGTAITEDTPFGPMDARNLYARSKALCETRLMALQREAGLPLVIARPGIVVGAGGPLQHWGIGRWHGAGAVRIWGRGHNILPFVLIEDVAEALVRMADAPGIIGQSFNLVGEPLLSARGYFEAVHELTGTRIRVAPGNLTGFYLADCLKFALKRFVLRRDGLTPPSRIDWKSRAHLATFANARAKAALGWQPEADAASFARRAILHPGFFGY